MFKTTTIDELKEYLTTINVAKVSYLNTYPFFVRYFKDIASIENEHLIIASHFVYGWMPTIIDLNLKNTDVVLSILNKVKQGELLNEDELLIGKEAINNSMVGLSKLLHFINPKKYAIWDSRIFRFLTKKKSTYGITEPKNYIAYLHYLEALTKDKLFQDFQISVNELIGYNVSAYRALEFTMFEADKKSLKTV